MKNKILSLLSKERDIINGNIPKNIIALAFPLMVGAMLQTTQHLIDIFWVGRLGPNSISAVAMSGTIIMFVFTISLGLGVGTLSLVAKNIGSGKREEADS